MHWLRLHRYPLAVIVLAQLCGTSLWFSINGVWLSLSEEFGFDETTLGYMTMSVQAGFITGTLAISVTGLADRFRASIIFAVSCLFGALFNIGFVLGVLHPPADLATRFLTGLCLAGIYPVGMKLVVSWTPKYAGAALSWLIGMLTLGTALPHLMRGFTLDMAWYWPLLGASLLALLGGIAVFLLGDGPHLPKAGGRAPFIRGLAGLKAPRFRAVASAYFGHNWEIYAFWMLTPFLVAREISRLGMSASWIPLISFAVIAVGFAGCVGGGWLSREFGSQWVAQKALLTSGSLCLLYPLAWMPPGLLLALLLLWGMAVVADSPQFSALAAENAPQHLIGSSLAVMNAIGFALTIPAIWITGMLWEAQGLWVIWWLLPGPVLGLAALRGLNSLPTD
jgi:MFS family permease